MKKIKAYASMFKDKIEKADFDFLEIAESKATLVGERRCWSYLKDSKIVPVLITPIIKSKKKK